MLLGLWKYWPTSAGCPDSAREDEAKLDENCYVFAKSHYCVQEYKYIPDYTIHSKITSLRLDKQY